MTISWELKLKLISLFCQGYCLLFTLTTLVVGLNVTLPEFSNGDADALEQLRLLAWFIFFNLCGNYFSIRYKARLSDVKSLAIVSRFPLLCPPENRSSSPWSLPHSSLSKTSVYDNRASTSWTHHANIEQNVYQDCTANTLGSSCRALINWHHSGNSFNGNSGIFVQQSAPPEEIAHFKGIETIYTALDTNHEPLEVLGGWVSCKECNVLAPPRAKHCSMCRNCVLKRDHHCFFAGCCVGFHNQRFFVIFCMYGGIGGIYSCIVTSSYLNQQLEAFESWGILAQLLPTLLGLWIFRSAKLPVVGMVLFFYWSLLTAIVCCYYFGVQIFLACRGQTKYELTVGIKTYQGTVWKNLASVFGRYWLIGFIVPAPFLGYQGNGVDWDEFFGQSKIL